MAVEKLESIERLYLNAESTRLIQRSKKEYYEFKNEIPPKQLYINIRDCDTVSSYNCLSSMKESNISNRNLYLFVVLMVL